MCYLDKSCSTLPMRNLSKLKDIMVVSCDHTHIFSSLFYAGTASDICYNSKLPRCCPTDVTRGLLKCVSATKLTVTGQKMTVNIYEASATSGILAVCVIIIPI